MGKISERLRNIIANNIRQCRLRKYPGWGGSKRCAEALGVSPQQWSPWERGKRTPDEYRLALIAEHFGVTIEYLRCDNNTMHLSGMSARKAESPPSREPGAPSSAKATAGVFPSSVGPFPPGRPNPRDPGSPESFYWLLDWLISRLLQQGLTIGHQGSGIDVVLKAYLGELLSKNVDEPPSTS